MKTITTAILLTLALTTQALAEDLLIKVAQPISTKHAANYFSAQGLKSEAISDQWMHVSGNVKLNDFKTFTESSSVVYIQKNYKIKLLENHNLKTALQKYLTEHPEQAAAPFAHVAPDNPAIPDAPAQTTSADPLFSKQWGMNDIGAQNAWKVNPGSNNIIVAVIDTGVDYTHEDLVVNMWRNKKEIPNNNIDDDGNGYIDDIVGWDFLTNDNKPYDLASTSIQDLMNGGNPGHGTHCAGNVAARGQNGKGISGVAPNAQIMALRFIGDEGGTTADAIKAIKYAVDNGAKVLSNSWGSEGDDPAEGAQNQALKDIITYAADHDVLFVAAAGNGHQGVGYDNDSDAKPGVPASYTNENIISVAAIGSDDKLGSFSNWGAKSVDIAAPGVKVFSTTVTGKYTDTLIPMLGVNWDGTSMACPHVAGAAALYWSAHPEKSYKQVKEALLNSAKKVAATDGRMVSNGKLNVEQLMKQ